VQFRPGTAASAAAERPASSRTFKLTQNSLDTLVAQLRNRYRAKASLRKVFRYVDEDHSGSIDRRELETLLEFTGAKVESSTIEALFEKFDDDKNGTFEYDEFIDLIFPDSAREYEFPDESTIGQDPQKMCNSLKMKLLQYGGSLRKSACTISFHQILTILRTKYQAKRSLRDEFRIIDLDKNGTVSKMELNSLFQRQGIYLTPEDMDKTFARFDFSKGGDDNISYDEFIKVVFPPKSMGFLNKDAMANQGVFEEASNTTDRSESTQGQAPSPESSYGEIDEHGSISTGSSRVSTGRRNLWSASQKLHLWLPILKDAFVKLDKSKLGVVPMASVEGALGELGCKLTNGEVSSIVDCAKSMGDRSGLLMPYRMFLHAIRETAEMQGSRSAGQKDSATSSSQRCKGATAANLGVLMHPATKPSRGALRRKLAMKLMYTQCRPQTAPSGRLSKKERRRAIKRLRKIENTFSTLKLHGPRVPQKGEHTPFHDTRNLIVSEFPPYNPLAYLRSSQAIFGSGTNTFAAKVFSKERMAKSTSKERLLANKRASIDEYNRKAAKYNDVYTNSRKMRMRTIIKSKLQYFEQLQQKFARDEAKKKKAGL